MTSNIPLFRALAETHRLRIVAATCDRALSVLELAAELRLPPAAVTHHVARLRQAGLLEEAGMAGAARYRFQQQPLFDALRREANRSTDAPVPDDLEAYDRKVLGDFLAEGRLKAIPVQQKKLAVILRYLARGFETGRTYPERAVNEALMAYHDDYATLRRALIDARLMRREKGHYWRVASSPDAGENVEI